MKFIILAGILKNKITIIERFTGKNLTLPVLSSILVVAENHTITLTATNLEIVCTIKIEAKVLKEGTCSIPAHTFSLFLQTLQQEEKITIEEKNGVIYLETDSVKTKILTTSPKDFPLVPKIKKESSIIIPKKSFQEALQHVIPAVAISQLKPELHGIFFVWDKKNHTVICAATDTFRLAEEKMFFDKENGDSFSFILPLYSAQEIIRFESEAEEVVLRYGESQIQFIFKEEEIISNTINGIFPQYQSIIPKGFETYVETETNEFMKAIKTVSLFSSKLQDVSLAMKDSKIEIHSENSDIGESTISVPAAVKGKNLLITFNYKFLLDGVSVLSGERMVLSFNTETSPILLRSSSGISFTYLLMPIRGV